MALVFSLTRDYLDKCADMKLLFVGIQVYKLGTLLLCTALYLAQNEQLLKMDRLIIIDLRTDPM